MSTHRTTAAWCLTHQCLEDQMSPIGLVCPHCKQRLYVDPPAGPCQTYWESQPAAYSLDGEPCFVYTLVWDDFRIRTLHPPGTEFDLRSQNVIREWPQGTMHGVDDNPDIFFFPWSAD